jgi:hypothetical protein
MQVPLGVQQPWHVSGPHELAFSSPQAQDITPMAIISPTRRSIRMNHLFQLFYRLR